LRERDPDLLQSLLDERCQQAVGLVELIGEPRGAIAQRDELLRLAAGLGPAGLVGEHLVLCVLGGFELLARLARRRLGRIAGPGKVATELDLLADSGKLALDRLGFSGLVVENAG